MDILSYVHLTVEENKLTLNPKEKIVIKQTEKALEQKM